MGKRQSYRETIAMINLPAKSFSLAIPFFNISTPNFPIVMSIIEGNNPGKIWIDRLIDPSICLVISNGNFSFIGKNSSMNESLILEIIEILKKHRPIKLILELNDPLFNLLIKSGFTSIERIQFHHPAINNHDLTQVDTICGQLPSDCEIKLIDKALLEKSNWLTFIKQFYGNENNFLKNGYGIALVKNGELISEAFACFIGGNSVETGSVTAEKYRGKGYATITRAFLIKESIFRNLLPVTSCNADNIGSAKVSEKLGFEEKARYRFLVI